ncbi:MAG: hypothetical protein HN729_07865 [Candidatus Marinimicrobia bacterium]|mgnify:FL=1|jgi:hypothetical protein|nr:hypothetical protein [Candidatus Neomarinimicrobiota bacterium]MBT3633055.1 hypothetical protein [Candidatus Neomarinimicrobiota bacterium]MBT3683503.1 hypothetical protein [Candidatus Neomarinimicrobiota bacterium]MBT3758655.1 hypothetical protein [Candidatus Neomarinimicrobiota bacterium]MBT3896436.1 hypothetical protein [Candidatus Neomarinimicrobiota bacterium]
MTIRFIIILFFSLTVSLTLGQNRYNVNMWGMTVATVEITGIDSVYDSVPARYIHFATQTTSLANTIYPVNSQYVCWTNLDNNRILSFWKESQQPNIINEITTESIHGDVMYTDTQIIIPNDAFNIFSFLDYLQTHQVSNTFQFRLEREGLQYDALVNRLSQNDDIVTYNLEIKLTSSQKFSSVVERTDIFTWAVFKPGVSRTITVDYSNNQIIKCEFQSGIFKLQADFIP